MPPCSIVPKWKRGRVRDRLQVLVRPQIVVAARNRRVLSHGQVRDGLRQAVAQVRVLRVAAVARPPAGVDGQLHQVGQPADLTRAGRLAAGQRAELVQVDGVRAVRRQIRVDEVRVALLVIGVVVDVLGDVLVQHREGPGVGPVPGSARTLAVLDPAELVVLLPQIGLEQLRRSQELENGHVTLGEATIGGGRRRMGQQTTCADGSDSHRGTLEQERTTVRHAPGRFDVFHDLLLQKLWRATSCGSRL